MLRIIVFLVVIALAAAGAAWVAELPGNVTLAWSTYKAEPTVPVFVLIAGSSLLALLIGWSFLTGVLRAPGRVNRKRRERRLARARHAITQGLLAVGHGDSATARSHANAARRHAPNDPLGLLLQAQSAQLEGDRDAARRAFVTMAGRDDTKSLGMRGLYIEAQRADDPYAALTIAEEALRLSPNSPWASHAVLGFRCARADWSGALEILEANLGSGLIDKKTYRRQRAVLLTARALEFEDSDESLARDSAMEAIKLAPTLVPAAVLASKYMSQAHQVRRAMKILETAWQSHPHPDLAEAYAHIKPGDPPAVRLARIDNLVGKNPTDLESALAIARAAIEAGDYKRTRNALAPFVETPTQRVAMLMAELEHSERGDSAKARAWTLRAVRALHDPVWTADGYVSDRWRPVSPVTGRLDAFQWQAPLSALPSAKAIVVDDAFEDSLIASAQDGSADDEAVTVVVEPEPDAAEPVSAPTAQASEAKPAPDKPAPYKTASDKPAPAESAATAIPLPPPMFHRRQAPASSGRPQVIPIVRAPDDPGIDEEAGAGDFSDRKTSPPAQPSGWRGYRRNN